MSPREHAKEIMALKSVEDRRARLQECPEWMRGLVQKHVENAMALAKAKAKGRADG